MVSLLLSSAPSLSLCFQKCQRNLYFDWLKGYQKDKISVALSYASAPEKNVLGFKMNYAVPWISLASILTACSTLLRLNIFWELSGLIKFVWFISSIFRTVSLPISMLLQMALETKSKVRGMAISEKLVNDQSEKN